MRAVTLLLLLVLAVVVVIAADDTVNDAYKRAREALDPDNAYAEAEVQYRMQQIAKCKIYNCESVGDPSVIKLSDAEIDWFKTMHKAVITLRNTYPNETSSVWCAIYSVLQNPEICQMHHASSLIASLSFLIQKDLATEELVTKLNEKQQDTKPPEYRYTATPIPAIPKQRQIPDRRETLDLPTWQELHKSKPVEGEDDVVDMDKEEEQEDVLTFERRVHARIVNNLPPGDVTEIDNHDAVLALADEALRVGESVLKYSTPNVADLADVIDMYAADNE